MKRSLGLCAIAVAGLAIAACAGSHTTSTAFVPTANAGNRAAARLNEALEAPNQKDNISHVFVIVQENRTVDNLFNGFPGANTVKFGFSGDRKVVLQSSQIATHDQRHNLAAFLKDTQCTVRRNSCKMNGFAKPHGSSPGAYAFVDSRYTKPYFAMAEQYAFGDNTFPSNLDASFVSHQYLVAAQANGSVDFPRPRKDCQAPPTPNVKTITQDRKYGPVESACFTYQTLGDELAAASLQWRYYMAPSPSGFLWWNPFNWIAHDRNAPGGKIIAGPSKFISDIQNPNKPYRAAVTWITPTRKNSDHAGVTLNTGPAWVAAVVNAIGTSKYWDSSVIFITWDDWGGWYDHVSPPYKDYDGLGVRVPFIIISPYTRKGLVTHTLYEQSSILKYIEHRFGLASLSASDARAADPEPDVISNGSSKPRPFATISAGPYSLPDDSGPPDDE